MLARSLAERHGRIRRGFGELRVIDANVGKLNELKIGDPVDVSVTLDGPFLAAIADKARALGCHVVVNCTVQRADGSPGTRVLGVGCHDRDVAVRRHRASENVEPFRIDAVVVGHQDVHAVEAIGLTAIGR